jgi:hypothetical protein
VERAVRGITSYTGSVPRNDGMCFSLDVVVKRLNIPSSDFACLGPGF